ncbi:Glutaredoxin [Evansella caseinilytica]|uniref:Glutaredoxin n=1 Tax=Evansella caseinilytica TaxID=1503961 RepID=A0A1H3MQN8_9BACI|nr:glutaredoxin family protein [Evansella caseinilytica]SDY79062.1 Glutaredoxin [Evansella caseinilytica]
MEDRLIVYTSSGCSYCDKVKELLDEQNVEYVEKNISLSKDDFLEWRKKEVAGTPTVIYQDEAVVGFDKLKLMKIAERIKNGNAEGS